MSLSFKVEGVPISAKRDRAMFNSFAGNKSYILNDIGEKLKVTYSSNSFVVSLKTGEAVICGGSMVSDGTDTLTLNANESGYLVIEVNLIQTGSNVCQFKKVSQINQQNINDSGMIYDLPLYQFTTNSNGVSSMIDKREISISPLFEVELEIDELKNIKQNKLTAGDRITITGSNNRISSDNEFIAKNSTAEMGTLVNPNQSGVYYFNNIEDAPEGKFGVGIVLGSSISRPKQLFIRTGTKDSNEQFLYQRSYREGWGQWYKYCPVFTPVSLSANVTLRGDDVGWHEILRYEFPANSIHLVSYGGTFQANANGKVRAYCLDAEGTGQFNRAFSVSTSPQGNITPALNGFYIVDTITVPQKKTLCLYGYQDSGVDLNAYGSLQIMRVG